MTTPRWSTEDRVAALKWPKERARAIREAERESWRTYEMTCALMDADVLLDQGMKATAIDLITRAAHAYRETTA